MGYISELYQKWKGRQQRYGGQGIIGNVQASSLAEPQIEDYPSGYPCFAAFVGAHESFQIYRRFWYLRTRLLLLKQDELSVLEAQLEKEDREEPAILFLSSRRRDKNQARRDILAKIDVAMQQYDELIDRNSRILGFNDADARALANTQKWLDGNHCISRSEIAYLSRPRDLFSLASSDDRALTRLTALVEAFLIRSWTSIREHTVYNQVSRDKNVYIASSNFFRRLARCLIGLCVVVLLLCPIIICNVIGSLATRLTVVTVASIIFVAVISTAGNASTVEVIVSGCTYAAVLVVFVAGTSDQES